MTKTTKIFKGPSEKEVALRLEKLINKSVELIFDSQVNKAINLIYYNIPLKDYYVIRSWVGDIVWCVPGISSIATWRFLTDKKTAKEYLNNNLSDYLDCYYKTIKQA